MNEYLIGVDLGQSGDYSTIAVVERAEMKGAWDPGLYVYRKETELRLRLLERIPLGTPYPEVVERVAAVAAAPALGAGRRRLVVDGTGVGRPVVDLLRAEKPPAELMPVIVVSGEAQTYSDGYYRVPKRDLIVGLQVMFQRGALKIARGLAMGPSLVEELQAMEVRTTAYGREQFGCWRSGSHDDLVFAVALAGWAAGKVWDGRRDENRYWLDRREAERAEVFRGVVQKLKRE